LEQTSPREADGCSDSEEFLGFMETGICIMCSKEPTFGLYEEQRKSRSKPSRCSLHSWSSHVNARPIRLFELNTFYIIHLPDAAYLFYQVHTLLFWRPRENLAKSKELRNS